VIGVLLATFMATFGALLIARRFPGRIALLSALSTALFLIGVLTMFTIGLVLLLASLVLIAVTAIAMRGHDRGQAAGSAVSGAAVAVGLIVGGWPSFSRRSWNACPTAGCDRPRTTGGAAGRRAVPGAVRVVSMAPRAGR
jgi:hypothetical protein